MSKTKDMNTFDFAGSSQAGVVRRENEDYSAYFECINGHVFVVCDGMGANSAGGVASKLAVETIRAYLENHYFDMPEDALKAAIEYANSVVSRKSKINPDYSGMATTIVMAMVRYEKVYYAHVGDSRLYIYTENALHKLTRDHSHAQKLIDSGEITEQEAKNHPSRFELTRVLGIGPNINIEISLSPAIPGLNDYIMLCTDGLSGMLSDIEISQVLQENISVQEKAVKLVRMTNENGGEDNATVQLMYFNNVANKRSKFVLPSIINEAENFAEVPKPVIFESEEEDELLPEESLDEMEPQLIDETEDIVEPEQAENPEQPEQPEQSEQPEQPQQPEQVNETLPVSPVAAEEKKLIDEEPIVEKGLPFITEPVMESKIMDEELPVYEEPVGNNSKLNFLNRFGFIRKLNEKPDMKKKVRMGAIILGVLFLAFVVWDLFIKQSAPTRISNKPDVVTDTVNNPKQDTLTQQQTQATAKPDTVWISYSVKKGDFLGTISSKFGIPVDYIKKKNKLSNDNIREKQKLEIPTRANHNVKSGESLAAIAKKYQVDKNSILKANDIKDEKSIKAGKDLIIPVK